MNTDAEDFSLRYRNDPRPTAELLHIALSKDADRDDEEYWHPVAALQHRLPEILAQLAALTGSRGEKERAVAATVLGQGRVRDKFAAERCAEILLAMLSRETSAEVLVWIIHALGHLKCGSIVGPLAALGGHPDPAVRHAVVSSLGGFADPRAVSVLIERTTDADREVRNWATFGLGSMIDLDTPALRDALLARLAEADDEIRGEALVGLARRGDARVIEPLLRELSSKPPEVLRDWLLMDEAAAAVRDLVAAAKGEEWKPVLAKLLELGIGNR